MAKALFKPEGFMTEAAFRKLAQEVGIIIPAYTEKKRHKPQPHIEINYLLSKTTEPPAQTTLRATTPPLLGHEERALTYFIPVSRVVRSLRALGLL